MSRFSRIICNSMMSYPNGTYFTVEAVSTQGRPHLEFEENHHNHTWDMTISKSFFFLRALQRAPGGLGYSFRTLFNNCYKTRNPYLITLKFGADKQRIKVNSHCMNVIYFQDVINNYLGEKLKVLSYLQLGWAAYGNGLKFGMQLADHRSSAFW